MSKQREYLKLTFRDKFGHRQVLRVKHFLKGCDNLALQEQLTSFVQDGLFIDARCRCGELHCCQKGQKVHVRYKNLLST